MKDATEETDEELDRRMTKHLREVHEFGWINEKEQYEIHNYLHEDNAPVHGRSEWYVAEEEKTL